jgi:hypothetical protein
VVTFSDKPPGIHLDCPVMSMTSIPHPIARLLLVATSLAAAGTGRLARAQDDHEPEENAEAAAAVAHIAESDVQRLVLIEKRAEHQLQRRRNDLTEILEALLSSRLDGLKQSCRLSEAQVKKLRVAGKVDIKRLMERGDDHIRRTLGANFPPNDPIQAFDLFRPLVERNVHASGMEEGILGSGSLLAKTLRRTLDSEQAQRYEQALAEKSHLEYRNAITRGGKVWGARVGLSRRQAQALVGLLMRETRPPKRYGRASSSDLFLLQIARLPEASVKAMLDETRWQRLSEWTARLKDGVDEAGLKRDGFIPDDTPIKRPAAPDPETKPKQPEG